MELVLDLHLHSRFSRAVSSHMNLSNMYLWGRKKGINVFTTADWTHPLWFRELRSQLHEVHEGVYSLKEEDKLKKELGILADSSSVGTHFILSTEVSSIYSENGVGHRIHNLIFSPSFEVAEKVNKEFVKLGFNLTSDGRPTFGITSKQLCELLFSIDMRITLIPCHIWTPWFSLYGSRSGYNAIADCFGPYHKYILAVETGLSSDPSMNWRIQELEPYSIVSFSDAHSLEKMGREATVLKLKVDLPSGGGKLEINPEDITYKNILNGFRRGKERVFEIAYTIEFYPEEGKYHYTGHRNCNVSFAPDETPQNALCPVCKRPLTVGVMHRVEELAQSQAENYSLYTDTQGVVWLQDKENKRPQFVSLVPLLEIIAEAVGTAPSSQKVLSTFDEMVMNLGSEHEILLRVNLAKIKAVAGDKIVEGIKKVRARDISINPGFDGEYGKVKIWSEEAEKEKIENKEEEQMGLF